MALQVDQKLNDSLPAPAPLDMPMQELASWAGKPAAVGNGQEVLLARLFVFGASAIITGFGTWKMYEVISSVDITALQVLFAAFFALTFAWIAFSCASAILGFVVLLKGKPALPPLAETCDMGRTALLMPVYNEDPERVFAALSRMAMALRREGVARHFDIFVLSDTRKDHIAAAELDAFAWLKRQLSPAMKVYYRRRENNHHRKAGNIADFVTRWGAAYDHMIVLDADSDMSATAMITLARAMAADPKAGIIQSLPLLQNRWTPFARMTQFAGRVYGPLVATGLSAWHGRDGNYWGHNAIIRTRAFAEACGLPELSGRKPFGGHVLSHDFVEAALIRRAGWAVYMLPALTGSYEETPPCLVDLATRDRRWAQGNLQHMKIVGAKGLNWVSRVHLIQGIMSYLASPLWLMLLLAGLTLATVARHTTPNYFPETFSLFPVWPVFDPELALRLFAITFGVLYLPKLLALTLALIDPELPQGLRRGDGPDQERAGGNLRLHAALAHHDAASVPRGGGCVLGARFRVECPEPGRSGHALCRLRADPCLACGGGPVLRPAGAPYFLGHLPVAGAHCGCLDPFALRLLGHGPAGVRTQAVALERLPHSGGGPARCRGRGFRRHAQRSAARSGRVISRMA